MFRIIKNLRLQPLITCKKIWCVKSNEHVHCLILVTLIYYETSILYEHGIVLVLPRLRGELLIIFGIEIIITIFYFIWINWDVAIDIHMRIIKHVNNQWLNNVEHNVTINGGQWQNEMKILLWKHFLIK